MDLNKSDLIALARILSIAGAAVTVFAAFVDQQQREQDNMEIAREVVKLLKEG